MIDMNLTYRLLDLEEIIGSESFLIVENFLKATGRRNIGWHYIIDLAWIFSVARNWKEGIRLLDAGGGRGPAQFLLAEMGFNVTNIDLVHRPPPVALRERYGLRRVRLESHAATSYTRHINKTGSIRQVAERFLRRLYESRLFRNYYISKYKKTHEKWRTGSGFADRETGKIVWMEGNLCSLPEIENAYFDAVVSLSALEHVPLESLPSAVREIRRVVRQPGGWAVTTSATDASETWFHEPSQGYCFSAKDIERIFSSSPDNGRRQHEILQQYRESKYLRSNLSLRYYCSGNNGMPWGRWNPQYVPVGLMIPGSGN